MPSTTVHGRLVLPKQANGDCVNLVDNKCVVYETRPRTCRIYDCRFHLFGLPLHNDCKVMREAVEQWEPFKLPTTEDKVAFGSIYTLVTEYAKKDPTLTGIAYLLTKWKTFRQQTYDLLQNVMRE